MSKMQLEKQLVKLETERANTQTELDHIAQRLEEIASELPAALRKQDIEGDKAAAATAKALRNERTDLTRQRTELAAQLLEYPDRLQSVHNAIAKLEHTSHLTRLTELRKIEVDTLRSYEQALWSAVEAHQMLTAVIAEHEELRSATDKHAQRLGLPSAPEGIPGIWPRPEPALFSSQRPPVDEAKERFKRVWYVMSQQEQFKDMV